MFFGFLNVEILILGCLIAVLSESQHPWSGLSPKGVENFEISDRDSFFRFNRGLIDHGFKGFLQIPLGVLS
jgi:hypothetical protein